MPFLLKADAVLRQPSKGNDFISNNCPRKSHSAQRMLSRARRLVREPTAKQIVVAGLRHPARTLEVGIVHAPRALGIACDVESEDNLGNLLPVGSLGGAVEQACIGFEVAAIIVGQVIRLRRRIGERWFRSRQRLAPCPLWL